MSEYERSEQQLNRAYMALAVQRIASEYHSGQWSKGYAKGCQASRILRRLGFRDGSGNAWEFEEVRSLAAAYLWRHRREIVATW